jgi:formylglycine-generating enzyme required for sulfatase activity
MLSKRIGFVSVRAALSMVATALIVFTSGSYALATVIIPTVPVGNAGNSPDSTGFGAVNYSYSIGTYDVTSSQYTAFLNAVAQADPDGLYNSFMAGTASGNPGIVQSGSSGSYTYTVAAGRGNFPVTDVSFWDATRFANWLANGQPNAPEGPGSTETGTYTLTPAGIAANTVTRNAGSTWAVTSQNEWYKAAYYSPTLNNGNGGYFAYAVQSNTITPAQANYSSSGINDTTAVGSYAFPSYYGTYDQAGDVQQWTESIDPSPTTYRFERGGAYDFAMLNMNSGVFTASYTGGFSSNTGFRVALVPEPASAVVALGSALALTQLRSRHRQR